MASPPNDITRNPRFLSAWYGAGCRVYDQRTRWDTTAGGGKDIHYVSPSQRWLLDLHLIDRDGSLKRDMLVHQETRQMNESFLVWVPQDSDISMNVPTNNTLVTVGKASKGATQLALRATRAAFPVPVYPRWFFRPGDDFFSHRKTYNCLLYTSPSPRD